MSLLMIPEFAVKVATRNRLALQVFVEDVNKQGVVSVKTNDVADKSLDLIVVTVQVSAAKRTNTAIKVAEAVKEKAENLSTNARR